VPFLFKPTLGSDHFLGFRPGVFLTVGFAVAFAVVFLETGAAFVFAGAAFFTAVAAFFLVDEALEVTFLSVDTGAFLVGTAFFATTLAFNFESSCASADGRRGLRPRSSIGVTAISLNSFA
jgi:hypothetical protein